MLEQKYSCAKQQIQDTKLFHQLKGTLVSFCYSHSCAIHDPVQGASKLYVLEVHSFPLQSTIS